MDPVNLKEWSRPWSTDEVIQNANNWSLAGDVALLHTIKSFTDKIFNKTEDISTNIDKLLNNLAEVQLKLDISQNEFHSLKNSQFIESRVYEDDEDFDSKEDEIIEKQLTEDQQEQRTFESLKLGLDVMEKYYDKVEISISDSEEEAETRYLLKPKDIYSHRILPPIIGTDEWYKNWHSEEWSSDIESEKSDEAQEYSESDSEENIPKNLLKGSETSSELDFYTEPIDNKPAANSTFNDSNKKAESLISSEESSEHQGSFSIKTPISNITFAEQLAAKLGNVINDNPDISSDVNKKPIKPVSAPYVGNLFFDEPPPLDDLEDTALPRTSGLFSGGQGIFDDDDEVAFVPSSLPEGAKRVGDNLESTENVKGLFDSDDSDDVFSNIAISSVKPPFLQSYVPPTIPLFDDEPPELGEPQDSKKKFIGGQPVLESDKSSRYSDINTLNKTENNVDFAGVTVGKKKLKLFDEVDYSQKIAAPISNLFDENGFEAEEQTDISTNLLSKPTKKISLFDEDDDNDLFNDNALFSNTSSKEIKSNLFDGLESDTDLFINTEEVEANNKNEYSGNFQIKKNLKMFSDSEEDDERIPESKDEGAVCVGSSKNMDSTITCGNEHVVEQYVNTEVDNDIDTKNISERAVVGAEIDNESHKYISNTSVTTESTNSPSNVINLFGSTPPPDDGNDDWDAKSDNFSDTEDVFSYPVNDPVRSSIFNSEPPSLGPNDSSGIVRDHNITRVDAEDSSFNPYASSTRRFSADIFNEQQAQDSFFITKNRTESHSASIQAHSANARSESETSNIIKVSQDYSNITNIQSDVSQATNDILIHENILDSDRSNIKSKILTITELLQKEEEKNVEIKESPNKLKYSIDINVNALKPGGIPPKLKEFPKSQSLDLPQETVHNSDENTVLSNVAISTVPKKVVDSEKAVSFDDDLENLEVLRSITKDRVKIPIKRKPSTRKGRKEAIRKSNEDFLTENLTESPSSEKGINTSTDIKDLKEPEQRNNGDGQYLRTNVIKAVEVEAKATFVSEKASSFDNEQDQLPYVKPTIKNQTTLFDSDDEYEGDLFESKKPKTSSGSNIQNVDNSYKKLFNDSSSDDELFSSLKKKSDSTLTVAESKSLKLSTSFKKLENIQTDDDPLSKMLNQ